MRYKFTALDESAPWAGKEVRAIRLLDIGLDDLADVLEAQGWKLGDYYDLTRRMTLSGLERLAKQEGREYRGEPAKVTAREEILVNQIALFGSLRRAGVEVTWAEARGIALSEYDVISDPTPAPKPEQGEEAASDPQVAPKASAPAAGARKASKA